PFLRFSCLLCAAALTGFYTLSLHDALPISIGEGAAVPRVPVQGAGGDLADPAVAGLDQQVRGVAAGAPFKVVHHRQGSGGELLRDRKSTRLNSSHVKISYAVFCLKKKTRT